MRNIIYGMISVIILAYATLISLCIYGIQLREHEMENRISQIAAASLESNYVPEFLREEGYDGRLPGIEQTVKSQIIQELERCSTLQSTIEPSVICLDLDKGILAIEAKETYIIPTGKTMEKTYHRTVIMERQEKGWSR